MGKGSRLRRQNGQNAASSLMPCNSNGKDEKKKSQCTEEKDKDDQVSQPCKRCEDEISKLRELNQRFVEGMNISRQEEFRKLSELESQIHIHEVAATNFQSKIDSLASERELLSQKNRELSTVVDSLKAQLNEYNSRLVQIEGERLQNEKVLQQCSKENIDLQSDSNDSKGGFEDLQRKIEDATHLWNAEKSNLEGSVAELQTKHDLLAKERRSWTQKNRELSIEVEFLKYQVNEGVKQQSDLIQQYKVAEHSLKQQNETLQEEVNRTKSLFEKQNKKFTESVVENGRLNEQVDELSKRFGELQETNVRLMQEKDSQRMEFEALHAETTKKYRDLEENHRESLKQNEEHGKRIETLHEDLTVEQSRNKELEEKLLSAKSSLEEINESAATSVVEIANLRSQLLAVEEEKNAPLSDIQRQLSAGKEEKKNQLASLQDQLSFIVAGKMILEEENKYLRTQLDRRTSVSKEEKVRLEGRVRELQTTFNSLNKELESSRGTAEEKEKQLVDLQNRHSDLVEAKKCLEEKNDSLVNELNRCKMVSEENVCLRNKIRELETTLDSTKKDNESKENHQSLISERQPLQAKLPVNRNGIGKPKPIEIGKPKPIEELVETSENHKPKCVNEKGKPKPNVVAENRTQKQVPQKPKRNPLPEKSQKQKQKPKRFI